jgi:uncharacterized protein YndB with AHSA1/START domain
MPNICHRVGIQAPPAAVYRALTTREGLAGWWTRPDAEGTKPGARMHFLFGRRGPKMEVVKLKPSSLVIWRCVAGPEEWLNTELTFEIGRVGTESVVLFGHRGWRRECEFMAHCSCKWGYFMLSLKSLLEDGRGTPFPGDRQISKWG